MSLVGGYGLLLLHQPQTTVIVEQSSAQDSKVTLRVQDNGLYYTLFGPHEVIDSTRVVGATPRNKNTEPPSTFPNYPAPSNSYTFPRAIVVALTHPWVWKPDVKHTQYTTFLLDNLPLPVVSLNAPNRSFFGKRGLHSVKKESDKEVEHQVHFQFLDREGIVQASSTAEVTVAGYSSKELPMKSLNLTFSKPVHSSSIFASNAEQMAYSLRLRNGGNDFLLAHMRDAVVSTLCESTYNIALDSQPVVVFINGEFWGIQYLREHITENYLREKYSELERSQILLGELHQGKVLVTSNGFDYQLGKLMKFIEQTDLSDSANYDSLSRMLSLPNFIDYVSVQTFVSNSDWPHNNVKGAFLNNKLHFLLYDTDFAFAYPKHYRAQVGNFFNWPDRIHNVDAVKHNYFDSLDSHLPSKVGQLYQALIKTPVFRQQFIERYRELLNGPLSQSRIQQVVNSLKSRLSPVMPSHIARWGYPNSIGGWRRNTQQIIEFCAQRRQIVLEQLETMEDQSHPAKASPFITDWKNSH